MTPDAEPGADWQRLDPRMMLVHPLREVMRYLVPAVGIFVVGTSSGGAVWQYLGFLVPLAVGLVRYLTTSFRLHGGRVELRRGLLNRRVLSTPVDRVRAVDLTASPIHRVLGVTTLRIGTGTTTEEGSRLDLDGLPVDRARELRAALLADGARGDDRPDGADASAGSGAAEGAPVVGFDPGWLRFAPFTLGGVVVVAAGLGLAAQATNELDLWERVHPEEWSLGVPWWAAVLAGVVGLLVVTALLSVVGYLLANWAFTLRRRPQAWHVSRGLLTTRETTVDTERLAGVSVVDALPLRAAGGARLAAIVTGLNRSEQGSETLVPAAPREVVVDAAGSVLGSGRPATGRLRSHGPAARRRRLVRATTPAVALLLGLGVLVVLGAPAWLLLLALVALVAAPALALDRFRSLGHDLVDNHVVARSGSLLRRRDVLHVDHVIGWTVRSTFFQRRAGLVTLVATTAGGQQAVVVPDVPGGDAVDLAREAHPDLIGPFVSTG